MRVPDIKFFNLFIKYDRERKTTLERTAKEPSSGKQLLYPSDNPGNAARVLRFKRLISTFERFNRNIDFTKTSLENAEATLDTVINTLQEARVKIIQTMNTGVINPEDTQTLKDYFESVKEYIINQANFKIGDNYKITNVEVIDKIIEIIANGDISQFNTATITVDDKQMKLLDAFDYGLNKIMEYRSTLGTQMATVENLKTQNENLKLHYSNLVSKLEDADYAVTISEYEKAKTDYDTLLTAIQQIKDLSLLKYYR